jgi:hypothetical protein
MQYEITPNVPGQWYVCIKGSHTEPPVALFYSLEAAEAFVAANNAEKVAKQEPEKEAMWCVHPIVCEHAFLDDDGRWNCAQCMSAKGE